MSLPPSSGNLKIDHKLDLKITRCFLRLDFYRLDQRVVPLRPTLDVVARVFRDEIAPGLSVVEIFHWKREISHLKIDIVDFGIVQKLSNEVCDRSEEHTSELQSPYVI